MTSYFYGDNQRMMLLVQLTRPRIKKSIPQEHELGLCSWEEFLFMNEKEWVGPFGKILRTGDILVVFFFWQSLPGFAGGAEYLQMKVTDVMYMTSIELKKKKELAANFQTQ